MAQARAQKRSIQSSPRKMRLMLDLIRGKRVAEAISILHFTPNHASQVAEKTLRSAVANFQLKPENAGKDIEELYVTECFSDGGPMLRRILPAPMGRAYRVRKRSNHLTIVVSDKAPVSKKNTRAAKKSASAPSSTPTAEAPKASRRKKANATA